ncbi:MULTISPECIES: LPXTG cell wall anchor domain-containing protein [unclassified Streptomyces]|uniref:LPXTG cell wall anchor domain-containing protein n=1 Tax=unclassified Streptomyces TaxID=2593676 RepID=UPI003D72D25B
MSSARRPLLTATAAGTLLCALWFVPSANATQDATTPTSATNTQVTSLVTTQARPTSTGVRESGGAGDGTLLADTGSFDTTPYVVGGTTLLALGAGFVVYSVRRERLGF